MKNPAFLYTLKSDENGERKINMVLLKEFTPEDNPDYTFSHTNQNTPVYYETANFDLLKASLN